MGHAIEIEKWAANLEEVTLRRWLKDEGDYVNEGDLLCEIITDKATFEYEIEQGGYVRRLFCEETSVLPVGFTIAYIGDADEAVPTDIEERNSRLLRQHQQQEKLELDLSSVGGSGTDADRRQSGVRATPAARRVARENDVSIEDVARRLKVEGAVSDDDVEKYIQKRRDTE